MRDVRVRILGNDRKINIENITALLAGGRVSLKGNVDVTNAQNPALDLTLTAREALAFRDPTTSVRANADITCRGTLQQATVAGVVEAVRSRVFKEIDLLPVLKLPADVPPVPPDTNKGHFHVGWTEFWFIMEGKIGMKVEGLPYFNCDPGDVMIAAQGRWHRAGDDPAAPWSTRVPFNPRPPILHNFDATGD